MTRKRRVFDIDMPEDPGVAEVPETSRRKGPMASAISENAEALQQRRSVEDTIRAENDALAHEYVALKDSGQVVQSVPLDQVQTYMLVRDRITGATDPELEDLVTSIRDIGLSNPIRVIPRPDGDGYELVQGYRRLSAYRQLQDAEGDAWAEIPVLVMPGAPDIAGLYRRMVDENVIRKDLSFAEMAHAAQAYAADPMTRANDLTEAVADLFQSAPYSKRSYIRSFALILDLLGKHLQYSTEIPRALGVNLARVIKERPAVVAEIVKELSDWDNRSAQDELDVLRRYSDVDTMLEAPAEIPATKPGKRGAEKGGKTKTTFHLKSRAGQVKCTASDGRLEIKVNRDFSAIDRRRLEDAISGLIEGLG